MAPYRTILLVLSFTQAPSAPIWHVLRPQDARFPCDQNSLANGDVLCAFGFAKASRTQSAGVPAIHESAVKNRQRMAICGCSGTQHRHICVISHFVTCCAIIARYLVPTSTKQCCDAIISAFLKHAFREVTCGFCSCKIPYQGRPLAPPQAPKNAPNDYDYYNYYI